MQSVTGRWKLAGIAALLMAGCNKPPAPAPVQSVPGTVVTVPSAPGNVAATPSGAPNKAAGPKTGVKDSAKDRSEKRVAPANTDPRNVFEVGQPGAPMIVESTKGIRPTDTFEVAYADLRTDSTRFIVDATKISPTNTLIGSGQPKSGYSLPKGFVPVKESGYSNDGYPLRIICTKTGSTLALVGGGDSIVGTDLGPEECKPSFSVNLDPYYMEILEVTVQDYDKFRTEQRDKKKPVPAAPSNPSAVHDTPALGVTWANAQNYARWAGMELPTEAEFEKAARGPHGMRTPWGDGRALWTTRPLATVGSSPTDVSPYGVFDLAGNAKEWCADLYSPKSHEDAALAALRESLHNWPGPKKVRDMNLRVVKGGGENWSSWNREGRDMGKSHFDVGFRCVLRIASESKPSTTATKPAVVGP